MQDTTVILLMCLHLGEDFFTQKECPGGLAHEHGPGLSGSTSLFPFSSFLLPGYFPNSG